MYKKHRHVIEQKGFCFVLFSCHNNTLQYVCYYKLLITDLETLTSYCTQCDQFPSLVYYHISVGFMYLLK